MTVLTIPDYDETAAAYQARFGRWAPLPSTFGPQACVDHWVQCLKAGDPDLDPYAHYPPDVTPCASI